MSYRSIIVAVLLVLVGAGSLITKTATSAGYSWSDATLDVGVELLYAGVIFLLFSLAIEGYEKGLERRSQALAALTTGGRGSGDAVKDLAQGRRLVFGNLRQLTLEHLAIADKVVENSIFRDCDLDGLSVQGSTLDGLAVMDSSLRLASFEDCCFKSVQFTSVDLHGALYSKCKFDAHTRFNGDNTLHDVRFSECTFADEFLMHLPNLTGVRFLASAAIPGKQKQEIRAKGGVLDE